MEGDDGSNQLYLKQQTRPPTFPYRPDIDGLRALAVVSVVIFHAWPHFFPSGFVGVDIFFVISGYLISSIIFSGLEKKTFCIRQFYARRIRRIFPALVLVLLFCVLFGWVALFPSEYQILGHHLTSASVFASNITLLHEAGYFDAASELKPLRHLWSLGIEEQFYIIWPLLIYWAIRSKVDLLWLAAIFALVSFGLNVARIDAHFVQTFYLPFTRFWELLLGAILAYFAVHHAERYLSIQRAGGALLSGAGFALLVSAFLFLDNSKLFPGWWALLPTMGSVLIIAAGSHAWINRHFLSQRALVFVGLISYPLYLWHWPLLSYLQIVESSHPANTLVIMVVVASLLLAWLTYYFVEKRLRHHPSPWVVSGLLVAVLSLGGLGVLIERNHGLPERSTVAAFKNYEVQMLREAAADSVCLAYVKESSHDVLFDYCRAANLQAKAWVAIIGDSHAHVLFRGFAEELAKRGYGVLVLANSSCPPFIGTATGKTDDERQVCSEKIHQIFELIGRDERITKVLIATRGPVYITGNGFGSAEKESVNLYIKDFPYRGKGQSPRDIFFTGLAQSIAYLGEHHKSAYYLLENPELGIQPIDCLGRPWTITNRTQECGIEMGVYQARMHDYQVGIEEVNKQWPAMKVLSMQPQLCDGLLCRALLNGKLLYADDDHLSIDGSRWVAPGLVSEMLHD